MGSPVFERRHYNLSLRSFVRHALAEPFIIGIGTGQTEQIGIETQP